MLPTITLAAAFGACSVCTLTHLPSPQNRKRFRLRARVWLAPGELKERNSPSCAPVPPFRCGLGGGVFFGVQNTHLNKSTAGYRSYGSTEREWLRQPERARCKSCPTPMRVVGLLQVTALIRLCQTPPNNPVRRAYTVVDGGFAPME